MMDTVTGNAMIALNTLNDKDWFIFSFVMSYSYVNIVTFELSRYSAYICLTVVIWEQHLGLDDFRSLNQLVGCHRVGLVAGKESNVYFFLICLVN